MHYYIEAALLTSTQDLCFRAKIRSRKSIPMLTLVLLYTRGDPEIRGKVMLNRVAFIDCNENLQI